MISSSLLKSLLVDIFIFSNRLLWINTKMRFVLFSMRFQVHASTNCSRKLYAYVQIFVQGHEAALDETKGSTEISLGLNEAGITALHCYRLFIQLFRHILPYHHLLFHLLPNTILYLEHLDINQVECKEFPSMFFETFYFLHTWDVWKKIHQSHHLSGLNNRWMKKSRRKV